MIKLYSKINCGLGPGGQGWTPIIPIIDVEHGVCVCINVTDFNG